MKIPLEFMLLRKIHLAFWHRRENGWVRASRTEITRKFLYRRRRDTLTAQEFYDRVLPGWIERDLVRVVARPRQRSYYLLRPMNLMEINGRIAEIEREARRLGPLLNTGNPDCQQGDLNRLGEERMALLVERKARSDQRLTIASHRAITANVMAHGQKT